tara:strand:+ start:833 stop:1177 length:345 start_codon:yes stop_codon:yes gene_type:complete
MGMMCIKAFSAHIGGREILGGYFSISSHTHSHIDMEKKLNKVKPQFPDLLTMQELSAPEMHSSIPPNETLSKTYQDWYEFEKKQRRSKAQWLGMTLDDYDSSIEYLRKKNKKNI